MSTIRSWVAELCTRKLAQQLYECVECASSERASVDWYVASAFVQNVPNLVDSIAREFIGLLAREQPLDDTLPATFVLSYEAFERLCGQIVWDRMFHPVKLNLRYPHTNIRFG